jgi:hypothetical protein
VLKTLDAIQKFVMVNSIAAVVLQMCSLLFSGPLNKASRWLRTPRPLSPSEETVSISLYETLFHFVEHEPASAIALTIKEMSKPGAESKDPGI